MHEKAWISYINREIKQANEALQASSLVTCHSFRVGFVTRHLKSSEVHEVARLVGQKSITTTVKYNRYVVDEERDREIEVASATTFFKAL
jgi:integrase